MLNGHKPVLSDADPMDRYRPLNAFTHDLTALCGKYGVAIEGGRLELINIHWNNVDAEKWEQYAINEDDFLVRGFWNQHAKAIVR
jgi:hypothetical protein